MKGVFLESAAAKVAAAVDETLVVSVVLHGAGRKIGSLWWSHCSWRVDVKGCKMYTGWWFQLGTAVFINRGGNTCAQDLDSFTAAFHIEQ